MPSAPRKKVFIEARLVVYRQCGRTVRQGVLCGVDAATGRDYTSGMATLGRSQRFGKDFEEAVLLMTHSTPRRSLSASARPRVQTSEASFWNRLYGLVVRPAFAASMLTGLASPASADPIFATYSSSTAGSLNGVGFSMTGLSSPGFGGDIANMSMSGAQWNSVGDQQGRFFNANTTTTFNVTFDAPVSNLEVYLYYFRGGGSGGGGYVSYTFNGGDGNAFTITGGLGSPITQSGATLDTSLAAFANGVISFTGPVSTLTVTATGGPATGGDQGFTLATVPEPRAVGFVAVAVAGTFIGFTARQRRAR